MIDFKIRASQISKIMGRSGLTEKQEDTLKSYRLRDGGDGKPLTEKQKEDFESLKEKEKDASLPTGCKTYLKEWYAENIYHDREEIRSKYCDKGNKMEDAAIDFTALMTGYMFLNKNEEYFDNGYIIGTPDVICDEEILDTKCSWNGTTFLDALTSPTKIDYEWQMRGYMALCGKNSARVCYCLMDTTEDVNYGKEISYSDIPKEWKFHTKLVERNMEKERAIIDRVELCRKWLLEYDREVKKALGL